MMDVSDVKKYIHANLRATTGLKEISAFFRKDPGYLDRQFRNIEGTTIKKYIDCGLKTETVSRLHRDGAKGYEIGRELGFWSDQSFYRWTKRVFEVSYSLLQNQVRSENNSSDQEKLPR